MDTFRVAQVLRIKKLKGCGIITKAARHNLREIQAEVGADSHIDPLKTSQNIILRGGFLATDVARRADDLMAQENVKSIRKDAVLGVEILFSLSPLSGIDERDFFTDAVAWAEIFFELPILSAVIHNDETAPHCHVIMLPLFNGRMIGSKKIGYKSHLKVIHADFHAKVGQGYGLVRQASQKRYSRFARVKAAGMVVDSLRKNYKHFKEPTICDALRDSITENPLPAMLALGLEMPKAKIPKPKTFAGIMTRKFKLGS